MTACLLTGLVLSLLAARGIGSLLVGVSPSDPVTLISVALLLPKSILRYRAPLLRSGFQKEELGKPLENSSQTTLNLR